MGAIGPWQIVIILVLALLLFGGGGKISSIMGDFAKGIRSFRKGLQEEDKAIDDNGDKAVDVTPVKESDKAALKAMKANVPNTMSACFSMIEEEMFKGPWVMGSQFTICDPYLFAIASWLEADGVDVTPFPLVMEHRSRMHERDSVKRVMAMQNA